MLALIYVSRVVPSRMPIESLFQAILATSRERNKALNITGLLAYADGCFLQLIEGERSAVLKQYAVIASDNRHTDVTILSSAKITQRTYTEWEMGGAMLSSRSVDMLSQLQQIRDAGAVSRATTANDYFRHLLTPMRVIDSAEDAAFTRPVRNIAICATSLVWLNQFFAFLRDLLNVKIDSFIASDPTHTNPNLPIDYCDIDHPKFGPLRITSIYADMMRSPLVVPLLHRTEYLLGLFARGSIEMKLNFANQIFQHPSILESRPQSVLVTQDDDSALKSLVTQYVNKAKLPKPTFLPANAEPKDCWENILQWLAANPSPSVVDTKALDFDLTAVMPVLPEPKAAGATKAVTAPVLSKPAAATLAPATPAAAATAIAAPAPKPPPAVSLAPAPASATAATTVFAPKPGAVAFAVPAEVAPLKKEKSSVGLAPPDAVKPSVAPTPAVAPPAKQVATTAPVATVTEAPFKETQELERIFNVAATLPGFRFAAIADTQSSIRTSIRAVKNSAPADLLAFSTALPLIQDWLILGVSEWSGGSVTGDIQSLIINQANICRCAYKLGAPSTYALVFELESKQTNIALTNLRMEELKAELTLD